MKQTLACIFLMIGMSFQGKAPEPKRYSVNLTLNQWSYYSNGLQYVAGKLRQSDLPSKEVALMTDSVLAPLLNELGMQIGKQQDAEKKQDTVKPKK
jgi:hypothetical protein